MPPVTDEEIYADMVDAFDGSIKRKLTKRGENCLAQFIQLAVVDGVHKYPDLYTDYREYLKCRFRAIAERLNKAGSGDVGWTEFRTHATAERNDNNEKCILLLPKSRRSGRTSARHGEGHEVNADKNAPFDLKKIARIICQDYHPDKMIPPSGGAD